MIRAAHYPLNAKPCFMIYHDDTDEVLEVVYYDSFEGDVDAEAERRIEAHKKEPPNP